METYNQLICKFNDKEWEDLTDKEKDTLINKYILYRNIRLPNTTEYKRIILDIMNVKSKKSVNKKYLRYLFFLAIKRQIEKDLEYEYFLTA